MQAAGHTPAISRLPVRFRDTIRNDENDVRQSDVDQFRSPIGSSVACLLLLLSACSGSVVSRDIATCEVGSECELVGQLTVYVGASASVGVLQMGNDCMPMALSDEVYAVWRQWDKQRVRVRGAAYSHDGADGVLSYELLSRWIATGVCGRGKVLYVTAVERM
jgi:hypothetical protein